MQARLDYQKVAPEALHAMLAGETEQRLYALSAWRDTPFYTPREKAALAWTEALASIQSIQFCTKSS